MYTVVTEFDMCYICLDNFFQYLFSCIRRFTFLFSNILSFKILSYNLWYQQKFFRFGFR